MAAKETATAAMTAAGVAAGTAAIAAAGVAAIAAAVVAKQTATAEQTAAGSGFFTAFPVAARNALLLHHGLLNGLVGVAGHDSFFVVGDGAAHLADFFSFDWNALGAADGSFLDHRNGFAAEGVVLLGAALILVCHPFDGVRFRNALGDGDRPGTGVGRCRRFVLGPRGGSRDGGNGAKQQSDADGLANHAFSFVAFNTPIRLPTDTDRWVLDRHTVVEPHDYYAQFGRLG